MSTDWKLGQQVVCYDPHHAGPHVFRIHAIAFDIFLYDGEGRQHPAPTCERFKGPELAGASDVRELEGEQ